MFGYVSINDFVSWIYKVKAAPVVCFSPGRGLESDR